MKELPYGVGDQCSVRQAERRKSGSETWKSAAKAPDAVQLGIDPATHTVPISRHDLFDALHNRCAGKKHRDGLIVRHMLSTHREGAPVLVRGTQN